MKKLINNPVLLLLAIIFPISFIASSYYRALFVFVNLLNKNAIYYLFSFLAFIFFLVKYVFFGVLEFAHLGILSSILLTTSIQKNKIIISKNQSIIFTVVILFICFINLTPYINIDPNYLGLAIYIVSLSLFLNDYNKSSILLMILGLFTYSRLFILIFILVLIIRFFKIAKTINKPFLITFLGYAVYFFITAYILYNILNGAMPDYEYLQGFDRSKRLIDTSNWIRFSANFRMFSDINLSKFFLGFDGESIFFIEFSEKNIYPHNLFLSLLYNVGIVWAIIYQINLIKVTKRNFELFCVILAYQIILGFGSFYIYLLPFLQILINNYEKKDITYRRIRILRKSSI